MVTLSKLFERVYSDNTLDEDVRERAAMREVRRTWNEGWGVGGKNPRELTDAVLWDTAWCWIKGGDDENEADSRAAAWFEDAAYGRD